MGRELEIEHEFIVNRLVAADHSLHANSITNSHPNPLLGHHVPASSPLAPAHGRRSSMDLSVDEKRAVLLDSLYKQMAVMHAKHGQRESQRTLATH